MAPDPLRIGLIGAGRIGRIHAVNIARGPETRLTWVSDPIIASAQEVAAPHGATATASADEVLGSGAVDALVIASPTPTHVDLIAAAVDEGIPVLCEKPIDLDIARVEALRPRVAAAGVAVALGFNRRFDPAFAAIHTRVAAGEIGALEQLVITSRDSAPPPPAYIATSGGLFRDMTIHDLDMARFFAPDIVEVFATGTALFDDGVREHGDVDTAALVLRSATGVVITIVNSRHSAYGYDQRLEAFGALGMLQAANAGTSLVSLSTATSVEARPPYQDFFLERYAEAYAAELREFVKLVHGEPSTSPRFEDGRAAQLLAEAAQRSIRERVAIPVDLS